MELENTAGEQGQYSVIPVINDDGINWFDAAGFSLAQSSVDNFPFSRPVHRHDFQLVTDQDKPTVKRVFSGTS